MASCGDGMRWAEASTRIIAGARSVVTAFAVSDSALCRSRFRWLSIHKASGGEKTELLTTTCWSDHEATKHANHSLVARCRASASRMARHSA